MSVVMKLGQLVKGQAGTIVSVGATEGIDDLTQRLMELGMIEHSRVEVVHVAPFGGDPIAVRVRGAVIALRRSEANRVEVQLEKSES